MNSPTHRIALAGALNVRDLGGLATTGNGVTRFGRLIRSGSLQELTPEDVQHLTRTLDVRQVIDLRSTAEVRREGPGPLAGVPGVTIHHLSLLAESPPGTDRVDTERAMPWNRAGADGRSRPAGSTGHYLRYCAERPDSVVAALRVIAHGAGATLVHCAMGKDRTGVVCALALDAVGVGREAVVADYTRSGEHMSAIVERLRDNPLYAADIVSRPFASFVPRPAYMHALLAALDERFGGVRPWLAGHGWTVDDQRALAVRLIG
ncbi:tyrosine-protein phosphatase [Streptomyces sp. SID10815]|uniref:tyrosine-protein phosphatase n=1 Tax=Streptomyces sp. SID10815 TaxID=2706027 RepID=UPI0013CD4EFA|nr:tyrosine-protein phosphatase [Streptomyces sp. SID10815]NEA46351.1 tyrosine-protein phosphatase [Streptomyces sp. SID10815]